MNALDIILAIPLLYGIYKGFTKGLIVEVGSLLALILGIYGGIHFSEAVAAFISKHIDVNAAYLPLISFSVTFICIILLVHLLTRALTKLLKAIALNIPNKIFGAVFGLLKVGFIISVVLVIVNSVDEKVNFIKSEHKEGSILYSPLSSFAPTVLPAISNLGDSISVPETPTIDINSTQL